MKTKYFDIAKRLAEKSSSKFKLGCCIVKKNKIIGFGFNDMRKTHPKCNTYGNYLHAELHSLLGLSINETKGATAYVYRLKNDGSMGMSKPCPVCEDALRVAGIQEICYTGHNCYEKQELK